jgi:MFS family permease
MNWLVYRLTGSPLLLGVVNFTGQAPTLLFTPFAGVIADRYDRHRLLVVTRVMAMLQAAVTAVLVLTNVIAVWHLVLLGLFLGMVNAFNASIRQSLIVDMIESREDLANAIALNSSMMNGARLVGPSIAGMGLETVLVVAAVIFGTGLIGFSLSPVFWVSCGLMIVSSFGMMVHMAAANTLVQTLVDDDKRGRVMGLHTMSVRGMVPLGSLIAGGLANQIGAPETVTLGGLCCVLGALIFASRRAAFKAPAASQPQ